MDLVGVNKLSIDGRHFCWITLIIIIDQRDWPPEEPVFGVDIIAPELQCEQKLLAVLLRFARHGNAQPDLERLDGRSRGLPREQQ